MQADIMSVSANAKNWERRERERRASSNTLKRNDYVYCYQTYSFITPWHPHHTLKTPQDTLNTIQDTFIRPILLCMYLRFYQWYQWYTNIVQGSTNGTIGNTNGTIGNTIGTNGNANGTIGPLSGTIGTNGKPMVPLATNGTIGKIPNGTIGRTPNARYILIDFRVYYNWMYHINEYYYSKISRTP